LNSSEKTPSRSSRNRIRKSKKSPKKNNGTPEGNKGKRPNEASTPDLANNVRHQSKLAAKKDNNTAMESSPERKSDPLAPPHLKNTMKTGPPTPAQDKDPEGYAPWKKRIEEATGLDQQPSANISPDNATQNMQETLAEDEEIQSTEGEHNSNNQEVETQPGKVLFSDDTKGGKGTPRSDSNSPTADKPTTDPSQEPQAEKATTFAVTKEVIYPFPHPEQDKITKRYNQVVDGAEPTKKMKPLSLPAIAKDT
jgi:hypothetical protein